MWKGQVYLPKVQPSKPKSSTFKAQTLGVLSLKSLTFQVQTLDVLSSKSLTFQAQTLDVLSLKSLTFQAQTLDVLSSKRLTSQAQRLMFYLPKVQRFKFKRLVFYLSRVQRSKPKSSMFQVQKPRFQVLNLAVRPYFVYPFALFSFSFSALFHPFLSAHRWLVPVHGSVYRGSLDAPFHPLRGCYHGSVGLFPD